ncbi:hypothetical protein MN608_05525 [Microdochium nivale]|nr:hypothetical protein MN608_05525 [Microdochium nivale]
MTAVSKDWTESFDPFDAIGFTRISREPPPDASFVKAIRDAYTMSNPVLRSKRSIRVLLLAYDRDQIETAASYLCVGGNRINAVADRDAWSRAFHKLYASQNKHEYTRTWAPETREVSAASLLVPKQVSIDMVDLTDTSPLDGIKPHLPKPKAPKAPRPQPRTTKRKLPHGFATTPSKPVPAFSTSGASGAERPDDDSQTHGQRGSDKPRAGRPQTPRHKTTTGQEEARSRPPPATRLRPLELNKVFVGFHVVQAGWQLLSGCDGPDRDYRQIVCGVVEDGGLLRFELQEVNMANEIIPEKHCLRVHTIVKHDEIVFLDSFSKRPESAVRDLVTRAAVKGRLQHPRWIPTPLTVLWPLDSSGLRLSEVEQACTT